MIITQNSGTTLDLKLIPSDYDSNIEAEILTFTDSESKEVTVFDGVDFSVAVGTDGITTFTFATGLVGLVDRKTYDLKLTTIESGILFRGQVYIATSADDTQVFSNEIRDSYTGANTTKNVTENKYKVYE